MSCDLGYIPGHLKMELKPVVPNFSVGEELFYRADPAKCKIPYDNISLRDISHNRSFMPPSSTLDDVLFNIDPTKNFEKYNDKVVVVLRIASLPNGQTYTKEFKTDDGASVVVITLKHDPHPCMYPHSVFEITVNGIIVDSDNYSQTLNTKPLKKVRSRIRQELSSMIQSGIVDQSEEIQIITEP